MKDVTRFKINEMVYAIIETKYNVSIPCDFCEGEKFIKSKFSNQVLECPRCDGTGTSYIQKKVWEPLNQGPLVVKKIIIKITKNTRKERYLCFKLTSTYRK